MYNNGTTIRIIFSINTCGKFEKKIGNFTKICLVYYIYYSNSDIKLSLKNEYTNNNNSKKRTFDNNLSSNAISRASSRYYHRRILLLLLNANAVQGIYSEH